MHSKDKWNRVGIFFLTSKGPLEHFCILSEAERYGDYLVYPTSHDRIWLSFYQREYGVDFDFFPRGRIAYNLRENYYRVFYDRCVLQYAQCLAGRMKQKHIELNEDEHYQCHMCNPHYSSVSGSIFGEVEV